MPTKKRLLKHTIYAIVVGISLFGYYRVFTGAWKYWHIAAHESDVVATFINPKEVNGSAGIDWRHFCGERPIAQISVTGHLHPRLHYQCGSSVQPQAPKDEQKL